MHGISRVPLLASLSMEHLNSRLPLLFGFCLRWAAAPAPDVPQKQNTNLPVERRGRKKGDVLSQEPSSVCLSLAIVFRTAAAAGGTNSEKP